MPRQSRIDFPGALNHVMIRGIERKTIFGTDQDKKDILKRLREHIKEKRITCFAFAVMSNHMHLLLQTGPAPLSSILQSIQTGYAVTYNLRHSRTGKLYQNRFKSILCDKEEYLLQLVRYIHLNPIKAGIIPDMRNLDKYPWTSHSIYMGKQKNDWFYTDEVLSHFGRTEPEARKEYRSFIKSGLDTEDPIDFEGGGLVRSLGGYWEALKARKNKKRKKEAADERILGCGEFVEEVLKKADEQESVSSQLERRGWGFEEIASRAAEAAGIEEADLYRKGRGEARSKGRALLCKWMVMDKKESCASVGKELGISGVAVSKLTRKGQKIEREEGISLFP